VKDLSAGLDLMANWRLVEIPTSGLISGTIDQHTFCSMHILSENHLKIPRTNCYNCWMKNPFIIWPSVVLWLLAIIGVFISQENEVINAIALLSSFWLVYLWWTLNKSRKGKI
jgi:hypothetical protein